MDGQIKIFRARIADLSSNFDFLKSTHFTHVVSFKIEIKGFVFRSRTSPIWPKMLKEYITEFKEEVNNQINQMLEDGYNGN